ncbi:MAG: hypothetical protein H7Z14_20870 [Anaerolineae bacterium]|nr:hypothetical protein [Phycisphaerae bacterium]
MMTISCIIGCCALCLMLCTTESDAQTAPTSQPATQPWMNPQPNIPYLPKPATRPADWIVEHDPVTTNASPEARALLKFLYQISGRHTLSGQHNFPNEQEYSTQLLRTSAGKTPAIYGTDFGFAKAGDKDSAYVRGEIVQELIKQHRDGSIITICWHAVRPIEDEPVTFRHGVCGKISDQEFEDLLTPGTAIHARWCAQVDAIVVYLKQLEAARVPILWRPYHEMNGDWFWWGGRRGERGTKQLYRQIFDRLVNHHRLTNLIWVWNIDRPAREDREFVDYFPGEKYVDVLALDDYHDYQQHYYDELNALSDSKVLAISECGQPPTPEIYKTQPKWTWWMPWAKDRPPAVSTQPPSSQPATTQPAKQVVPMSEIVKDPRIFNLEDATYRDAITEFRAACGLPPLPKIADR